MWLADGRHHVSAEGIKFGMAVVVVDDVVPALDGQLDASAIGINHGGENCHRRVQVMGNVHLVA